MIKHLFEKFITGLKESELKLNNYDKNIINLIYNNFEEIKKLGLRNGRGKKISELILFNINNEDVELPKISTTSLSTSDISNQNKIGKLEVGHFRGFQDLQEFNFGENLNVIYGRNGYGKSSFSEALEYGLTGYIKECHSRGFKNKLSGYIKNIHSEGKIFLNIIDNDGNKIEINEEKFRYNFIEKNRIDFFVNSKNTTDSDLLSNLFGYGFFNDFCDDFSQTLSSLEYKDDFGKLEGELNGYKRILDDTKIDYEEIKNKFKDSLNSHSISYDIDNEFDLLNFNKIIDEKIDESKNIVIKNNQLEEKNNELKKLIDSEDNNYKKYNNLFYGSIIIVVLLSLILSVYNYLGLIFLAIVSFFLISYIYKKRNESNDKIIKYNSDIVELEDINYDEISYIQQQLSKIKDLGNTFSSKLISINDFEKKIENFKKDNELELSKIEGIKNYNERIDGYKNGYRKFKESLDEFKIELSQGVIKESMEERTKDIFNFLSQYKDNKIVIEKLNLPKSNNDNIEIIDKEGKEYLALQLLSEGNLRALAISILFAKVLEDNLSFIICDDINNALDEDFKDGLVHFLNEYSGIENLQLILSTHSFDFNKHLLIGNKSAIKYVLSGIKGILVNKECGNKLELAKENYKNGNFDSCLNDCRQELESILDQLGKRLLGKALSVKSSGSWNISTDQKKIGIIKLLDEEIDKLKILGIDDKEIVELTDLVNCLKELNKPLFEYRKGSFSSKVNQGSHSKPIIADENFSSNDIDLSLKLLEKLYSTYNKSKLKLKKYFQ